MGNQRDTPSNSATSSSSTQQECITLVSNFAQSNQHPARKRANPHRISIEDDHEIYLQLTSGGESQTVEKTAIQVYLEVCTYIYPIPTFSKLHIFPDNPSTPQTTSHIPEPCSLLPLPHRHVMIPTQPPMTLLFLTLNLQERARLLSLRAQDPAVTDPQCGPSPIDFECAEQERRRGIAHIAPIQDGLGAAVGERRAGRGESAR
jgi:hypothetical protein